MCIGEIFSFCPFSHIAGACDKSQRKSRNADFLCVYVTRTKKRDLEKLEGIGYEVVGTHFQPMLGLIKIF